MDHFVEDEGIEMGMQNPMMVSQGNEAAQRAAEDKARALEEQLEQQNQANMKMAEEVRAAKKQGIMSAAPRRRGAKKKKKNGPGQQEFGPRKVDGNRALDITSKGSKPSLATAIAVTSSSSSSSSSSSNAHRPESLAAVQVAAGAAGTNKLAKGWRQSIDVVSGKPYYYRRETGETCWELPTESSTVI